MRRIALLGILGMGVAHLAADDRRVPVIVELFTSEGCSSCPPADYLLARLERTQPVSGARIIALEEHVDYWNQLGWVDPFSGPQYRARQNDYALTFHTDNIYTPQMVVNGQSAFQGDDGDRAMQEIGRASRVPGPLVELRTVQKNEPGLLDLEVHVMHPRNVKFHDSNVFLAVTESDLSTNVYRGENTGRTLHHGPVVRSFGVIGRMDAGGSPEGRTVSTLRLPGDWKRDRLHAVVFVQERDTFRITGAGIAELR